MERIVEQTLLYDFYGELLTEHQKSTYEAVILNDYSLSEVADELGISRQGVHDLVKRCNRLLAEYETKLCLVEKFIKTKQLAEEIKLLSKEYIEKRDDNMLIKIEQLSIEIEKL